MGIPCAPQLANIWMASFDKKIKGDSKIYAGFYDTSSTTHVHYSNIRSIITIRKLFFKILGLTFLVETFMIKIDSEWFETYLKMKLIAESTA